MKKKILLLAVVLIVIGFGSIVIANVPYIVTLTPDEGDFPEGEFQVTFVFGLDIVPVDVDVANNIGTATTLRAAWWYGNWSATIDAGLVPIVPPEWSQIQGGANNEMEWEIRGESTT